MERWTYGWPMRPQEHLAHVRSYVPSIMSTSRCAHTRRDFASDLHILPAPHMANVGTCDSTYRRANTTPHRLDIRTDDTGNRTLPVSCWLMGMEYHILQMHQINQRYATMLYMYDLQHKQLYEPRPIQCAYGKEKKKRKKKP